MKTISDDFVLPKYKEVLTLCEDGVDECDLIAVQDYNNLWGFIDKKGNEVIPCQFLDVSSFNEGYSVVEVPSLGYNWMNKEGKFLNDAPAYYFYYISAFKEGYAIAFRSNQYYIVNKSGEIKEVETEPWFFAYNVPVIPFNNGCAPILVDKDISEYALVDYTGAIRDGKKLLTFEYTGKASEGFVPVRNKGGWAYLKFDGQGQGKIICDYKYRKANSFSDGMAAVRSKENGLWGYIDEIGQEVIPCQYKLATPFENGLAIVSDNTETPCMFYINKKGEKQFDRCFENAWPFVNGLAIVKIAFGNEGVINAQGDFIIPPIYEHIFSKDNNNTFVVSTLDKKTCLFDNAGNLFKTTDKSISSAWEGKYRAKDETEKKSKYLNCDFEELTGVEYETAKKFVRGYAVATRNGRVCILNAQGEEIKQFPEEVILDHNFYDKGQVLILFQDEKTIYYDRAGNELFSLPNTYVSTIETDSGLVYVQASSYRTLLSKKRATLKRIIERETKQLVDALSDTEANICSLTLTPGKEDKSEN